MKRMAKPIMFSHYDFNDNRNSQLNLSDLIKKFFKDVKAELIPKIGLTNFSSTQRSSYGDYHFRLWISFRGARL